MSIDNRVIANRCYKEIRRVLANVKPGTELSTVDTVQGIECHHVFGRVGLLYINPRYIVPITTAEHAKAHKDKLLWASENGFRECFADEGMKYTHQDLKALLASYRICRKREELINCYDAWMLDLRGLR